MNYYNDNDPKSCAWIQELINEKLIPQGKVDCRSITDVRPEDVRGFTQCHFFCGIAGWPYALQLAGWPEDRPVWTGSCPCQPFSCAGKGLGEADERHLWPAFFRLIDSVRPPVVFGEQVASKAALSWIDGVFADLERAGYACGASDLCAAGVGAPHIRQRLYWVAHHHSQRLHREPVRLQSWQTRQAGLEAAGSSIVECDCLRWLADAEHSRHGEERVRETGRGEPECDRGLGHGQQPGLQGHPGHVPNGSEPGRDNAVAAGPTAAPGRPGFWVRSIWHQCRDGKARRISPEPALFPLAHGIPGRVGLLRGAGNAIVPPLAAAFIQSVMESINQ